MKKNRNHIDVWHSMLKLIDGHPDRDVKTKARMLFEQYNTAGGMRIKGELENMIREYGY